MNSPIRPSPRPDSARGARRTRSAGTWLVLVTATLLAACRRAEDGLPVGTPVVLVIVDTLSAQHLAAYGYELETAPNFTEFAAGATLFEHHTTQCNSTFPSISSILTGLYPKTHRNLLAVPTTGTYQKGRPGASLAERLGAAGYHTIGIASHPSWAAEPRDDSVRRGWDSFSVVPPDVPEPRALYGNGGYTNERLFALFDAWDEARDGPLFCWAHYFDPHTDLEPLVYVPPPEWRDRFLDAHLARAGLERFADLLRARDPVARSEFIASLPPTPLRDALRLANGRALYDAEIAYCDFELQRFFDRLRDRGLWDRALVIFCADHGENLDGRTTERGGIDFTHQRLFEAVVRTPLAIKLPGQTAGRRIRALSQNIDLVPTLLELLDLPAGAPVEGRSLASLLRGTDPELTAIHDRVYVESSDNLEKAVRDADWKYFDSDGAFAPGLFQWRSDPGESTDRIGGPPDSEAAAAEKELDLWLREFRPKELLRLACLPAAEAYTLRIELELGTSAVLETFDARGLRAGELSEDGQRWRFEERIEDRPVELTLLLKNRKPPFTWTIAKNGRAPDTGGVFLGQMPIETTTAVPFWRASESVASPAASVHLTSEAGGEHLLVRLEAGVGQRTLELFYELAGYDKTFEVLELEGFGPPSTAPGSRLVLEAGPAPARALLRPTRGVDGLQVLARSDGVWPAHADVEWDGRTRSGTELRMLWPLPGDKRLNAALLAAPELGDLPPGALAIWREGGGRVAFDAARLDPAVAAELRALGYLGDE